VFFILLFASLIVVVKSYIVIDILFNDSTIQRFNDSTKLAVCRGNYSINYNRKSPA